MNILYIIFINRQDFDNFIELIKLFEFLQHVDIVNKELY